jgi:hypothetical protein
MITCEACRDTGYQQMWFLVIPRYQSQAMHQPTDLAPPPKIRDVPCPACSPDLHHNYLSYCHIKDMRDAGYGEINE